MEAVQKMHKPKALKLTEVFIKYVRQVHSYRSWFMMFRDTYTTHD